MVALHQGLPLGFWSHLRRVRPGAEIQNRGSLWSDDLGEVLRDTVRTREEFCIRDACIDMKVAWAHANHLWYKWADRRWACSLAWLLGLSRLEQ